MSHSLSSLVTSADPRTSQDDFRELPETESGERVVLVGVVHEHPASVYRVVETVTALDPDIVALELPSLAMPLFTRYATDYEREASWRDIAECPKEGGEKEPPEAVPGGEMSAAIGATDHARVVGIDLPNLRYGGAVIDAFRAESLSVRGVCRTARAFGSQLAHAIHCRVAHAASRLGVTLDPGLDDGGHECTISASAQEQATEEADLVAAGTTLLHAFNRPAALRTFDSAREAAMADALRDLRREGTVVAIVGYAHLNPITEALEADPIGK